MGAVVDLFQAPHYLWTKLFLWLVKGHMYCISYQVPWYRCYCRSWGVWSLSSWNTPRVLFLRKKSTTWYVSPTLPEFDMTSTSLQPHTSSIRPQHSSSRHLRHTAKSLMKLQSKSWTSGCPGTRCTNGLSFAWTCLGDHCRTPKGQWRDFLFLLYSLS